jgi:EmrB/QacA subfamily drug resistance transporter
MTLANAMVLVDQTAVPLALPDIMDEFDKGGQDAQWVLTAGLLPLAGLLVFGGRIGDLVGQRRVFLTGASLFAGASAVGGLAPSFEILLVARVAQGVGGALMLPNTIAIVSSVFPEDRRGRALGTMGGAAAVFAALGPTLGGALTSAVSWRAVLLINVPLAIVAIVLARRHVPGGAQRDVRSHHVDLPGTALLSVSIAALVFGLSQSQDWGWGSPGVWLSLGVALLAGLAFVARERRAQSPLVSFGLLRTRNYMGASVSQLLAGMVEIGLGVIFPPLLILNLEMSPVVAGLALIPTTVPMILIAPLAGRWYDRAGGRLPLATGFGLLALSGVMLAVGVETEEYLGLLPGLLVYGIGLSLVLTVNDPVTLDSIPADDEGQASGVSATAEQFGGALGIAILYSIFHAIYVDGFVERVDESPLPDLTAAQTDRLRDALEAAEGTGLQPELFDDRMVEYLRVAGDASMVAYEVTFGAVTVLALVAFAAVLWLVRRPSPPSSAPPSAVG